MVIDSSAIVAILFGEDDAKEMAVTIIGAETRLMSAASYLETAIVVESRYGEAGTEKFDQLLQTAKIQIESVTAEQAEFARVAYRSFGKGRHPAKLNFGDCFSYALAKVSGLPLLCKGDDFVRTDIALAEIISDSGSITQPNKE